MRRAGILAHISSLNGRYGIGTLGKCAYDFIDFLNAAGFKAWQMLPINPVGNGFSPYQSPASMRGNPLFIDPDILLQKGLIKKDELPPVSNPEFIDYPEVTKALNKMLPLAASRSGESNFIESEFDREFFSLRAYANSKGIELIGDMPIYSAKGSEEISENPQYFSDSEISGCPPDAFSETGQVWNNPVYNWENIAEDKYSYWTLRVKHALKYFDLLRLDHFRAFSEYWAIPKEICDARFGSWKKGPGIALFKALENSLGSLPFIAEDLGYITDDVIALKDAFNLPGMAVLQFAFDSENSPYLPENITENSVCYTGTHDNNTTLGWALENTPAVERAKEYFNVNNDHDLLDAMISACLNSKAELAILPIQDILRRDSRYRMNTPGTASGNWKYRIDKLPLNIASEFKEKLILTNRKSD